MSSKPMDRLEAEAYLRPKRRDLQASRIGEYALRPAYVVLVERLEPEGRRWRFVRPCTSDELVKLEAIREQFGFSTEPVPGDAEYFFVKLGSPKASQQAAA